MKISTKGRYALRLMLDLAVQPGDAAVPLRDVARRQEISDKYLESIVKTLVRGQVLDALRGKGGGYRLHGSPEQYTIRQLIELIEGPLAPVSCLEPGKNPCGRVAHCRTLPLWQGLEQVIGAYLDQFTLADLVSPEAYVQPGK